ncbi:MAG: hypothetical protein AB7U05_07095 [Mangrovibacterium sp.]
MDSGTLALRYFGTQALWNLKKKQNDSKQTRAARQPAQADACQPGRTTATRKGTPSPSDSASRAGSSPKGREKEKSHQLPVLAGGEKGSEISFRGNSTTGGERKRYALEIDE